MLSHTPHTSFTCTLLSATTNINGPANTTTHIPNINTNSPSTPPSLAIAIAIAIASPPLPVSLPGPHNYIKTLNHALLLLLCCKKQKRQSSSLLTFLLLLIENTSYFQFLMPKIFFIK